VSLSEQADRTAGPEQATEDFDPSRDEVMARLSLSGQRLRALLGPDDQPDTGRAAQATVVRAQAAAAEAAGYRMRLRALARAFALTELDLDLLLAAALPDVDEGAEAVIARLTGDRSRGRPTVGLALRMAGEDPADPSARARLSAGAPLAEGGLLDLLTPDRPFLSRGLRVPDRVVGHLLGDDAPDPAVRALTVVPGRWIWAAGDDASRAAFERGVAALQGGALLGYAREYPGGDAMAMAAAVLSGWGATVLAVSLPGAVRPGVVEQVLREARLRGAALIIGPVEHLTAQPEQFAALLAASWPVVVTGRAGWDPNWSRRVPFVLEADPAPPAGVAAVLAGLLGTEPGGDVDLTEITATLRVDPHRVEQVAQAARLHAAGSGGPLTRDDVRAGIRSQNAAGLERLARRIEPAAGWEHLVLPPRERAALEQFAARIRWRDTVLTAWGMADTSGRGRGVAALFAGSSGTGKTLAAEVVAGSLGLDLYTVDLSSVVDKYVGETEKNLERIFGEAEQVNGVLFFDEADALFGKRSEVKDAHDRYANVETAYLLQRLEAFGGVVVLATNLRANLDDAFTRRLDIILDFPAPDAAHRRLIWERQLRPGLPRGDDLDLDFLAERFELTGGNIRNVTLAGAYLAAREHSPVCMTHLVRGIHRELLNLGRLVRAADFGPYEGVLA
jgi:ATPase family associated with various cellular activities (AAA)